MWERSNLKTRAKNAVGKNYWRAVLVAFVIALLYGGGSSISVDINSLTSMFASIAGSGYGTSSDLLGSAEYDINYFLDVLFASEMVVFWIIMIIVLVIAWVIAICFSLLICLPLEVGACRFFVENGANVVNGTDHYIPTSPAALFSVFRSGNYLKTIGIMWLKHLFTTLWTFLFIIPGIVKAYEYRMIPYLMADCPQLRWREAFRISKEMMRGQKWNTFVLDLSFIGWHLLSGLTLGILNIFYVNPYVHATDAELFLELKRQYFGENMHFEENITGTNADW